MSRQAALASFPSSAFANETTARGSDAGGTRLQSSSAGTSYALIGSPQSSSVASGVATLARGIMLAAAVATVAVTPKSSSGSVGRALPAQSRAVAAAPGAANFVKSLTMSAAVGGVAASPGNAGALHAGGFMAAHASIAMTPRSAAITRGVSMPAGSRPLVASPGQATLIASRAYALPAQSASTAITGKASAAAKSLTLAAGPSATTTSSGNAGATHGTGIMAARAPVTTSPGSATIVRSITMPAAARAVSATPGQVVLGNGKLYNLATARQLTMVSGGPSSLAKALALGASPAAIAAMPGSAGATHPAGFMAASVPTTANPGTSTLAIRTAASMASSRQGAVASFPTPSYVNEVGTGSAATGGAYLDQTQGTKTYNLAAGAAPIAASPQVASLTYRQGSYTLAAAPTSMAATANMASLSKTTAQGSAYSFMATAGTLALASQFATLSKSTAPASPMGTRQAAFASFPTPAYLNEGYGSQRALSGGYVDETPQPASVKLAASSAGVGIAAPAAATTVHVGSYTLAAGPASATLSPQAASLSTKLAPIVLLPSRFGLGLGIRISFLPTVVTSGTNYILTANSGSLASQVVSAVLSVVGASASGAQPLRVVASGPRLNDNATSGSAGKTQSISRQAMWMGGDASGIRLSFANWYYAASGSSVAPATALTIVKVALEKGDGSQTIPLTFGGSRSIVLQPLDTDIQTDAIQPSAFGLTKFAADSAWYLRCSMLLPETTGVLPTNVAPAVSAGSRCFVYPPANDIEQVDRTGAVTTPTNASGTTGAINAVAVLGRFGNDAGTRSIIASGDSQVVGVGDSAATPPCPLGYGFFSRALSSNGTGTPTNVIAAIVAARGGSYVANHASNTQEQAYLKYAKTLFYELGGNTIGGSGANGAQTAYNQAAGYMQAFRNAGGQRIIWARLTPDTNSTNNWTDYAGQTPVSGRGLDPNGGLDTWHKLIDQAVSSGIADVVSECYTIRGSNGIYTDPNYYLWYANGTESYATNADGLHCSVVGHGLKAADTRPVLLQFP